MQKQVHVRWKLEPKLHATSVNSIVINILIHHMTFTFEC